MAVEELWKALWKAATTTHLTATFALPSLPFLPACLPAPAAARQPARTEPVVSAVDAVG